MYPVYVCIYDGISTVCQYRIKGTCRSLTTNRPVAIRNIIYCWKGHVHRVIETALRMKSIFVIIWEFFSDMRYTNSNKTYSIKCDFSF